MNTTENQAEKNQHAHEAGCAGINRAQAVLDQLNRQKSAAYGPTSGGSPANQPFTPKTDAARSGGHAVGSGGHPAQPGADANRSGADPATPGANPHRPGATGPHDPTRPCAFASRLSREYRALLDKRSALDQLPPETMDAIAELLDRYSDEVVSRFVAAPPPDGLGLQCAPSSFRRFRTRHLRRKQLLEQSELTAEAAALLKNPEAPDAALIDAGERHLKFRFLKAASDPETPLDQLETISRILGASRKQSLAEQKQTHANRSA